METPFIIKYLQEIETLQGIKQLKIFFVFFFCYFRRAHGSVPTNPVLNTGNDTEPLKSYQTYDMSGSGKNPKAGQQTYIPVSTEP